MRIYYLSKVLILPLVLIAIAILAYGEYNNQRAMTAWVIVPGVLLTLDFIFAPQIDFWWQKKYPIPIDEKIKQWLIRYSPYYNMLQGEDKQKYEHRLSLYIEGREFKSVGQEIYDIPDDLKGSIASIPVMLTLQKKDFLMGDYDRIYMYKHAFPSPEMKFLHSVEVNHEDGVILFSLEHLLPGFTRPQTFYPIGLHAYLEVYLHLYRPAIVALPDWEAVKKISSYQEKEIKAITGLPDISLLISSIICYFVFPERLRNHYSVTFISCQKEFSMTTDLHA